MTQPVKGLPFYSTSHLNSYVGFKGICIAINTGKSRVVVKEED